MRLLRHRDWSRRSIRWKAGCSGRCWRSSLGEILLAGWTTHRRNLRVRPVTMRMSMTTEATTETKFALEGFFPGWAILLLGVGLLALSWWMARRDARFADRPKLVWWLFLLRCVAILVLLWMLAGPTLVTTVRKFKTKSVAMLVDTSASMGLVDVIDGSGNVSRWAAARTDDRATRQLAQLDEAVARVARGAERLQRFSKLPNGLKNLEEPRRDLALALSGAEDGSRRSERDRARFAGRKR